MRSSRGTSAGVANVPLTIVCGPSPTGAAALLLQLVTRASGMRIAAVFADVTRVAIDPALIEARDGDILQLRGGSVCCGRPGECDEALMRLMQRDARPDHVVVEAGISPRRAKGYAYMPGYRPDGVVAVVDASGVAGLVDDPNVGEAIREQLARANVVVLHATHAVSRSVLAESHRWLRSVASQSRVIWSGEHGVAPPLLLGVGASEQRAGVEVEWSPDYVPQRTNARGWAKHSHDGREFGTWRLRSGAVGAHEFRRWASSLPSWIVRGSGTITLREMPGARQDFHFFGHEWSLQPRRPRDGEPAESHLVLVGLSPDERSIGDAIALGPIGRNVSRRDDRKALTAPRSTDAPSDAPSPDPH
ncbi:MAG TPA: GTP-binding protein [Gemmatimonadaceae bacterium]|nr:GTP-binding protein [Gemmatimonadaceae bacterium]